MSGELFERDGCCVKTPLGKSVAFSSPSDAKIAASLANYAVTVGEHFAAPGEMTGVAHLPNERVVL